MPVDLSVSGEIQMATSGSQPAAAEDYYIHRAGRTARGNAQGIVSSIAIWLDKLRIKEDRADPRRRSPPLHRPRRRTVCRDDPKASLSGGRRTLKVKRRLRR